MGAHTCTLSGRVVTPTAADARPCVWSAAVRFSSLLQQGVMAEGIEGQTEQALKNLSAVVEAGGSTMDNVLKVRSSSSGAGTGVAARLQGQGELS